MGGKNDIPNAPDYGPLAAASQKSAEYSYKTAQDQLDWAKKTYADNKAVGDQVIDFAMGQMDKQSAWADHDRAMYEDTYEPLMQQQAARAQDYASPERQEAEAGKAEADVAQQFDSARRTAQDRLESYGVDPSQTRSGALDAGTRIAQAAASASAGNTARFRTEQYGDQLMANAVNTGKGFPQQSLAESGAAGASGNQATNTGLATTASGANTMGTGTQWQGLGNQAIGQWGQTLNAGFQNELASAQANNQASSGWGSALGLGASLLSAPMTGGSSVFGSFFAEDGGAIPDELPMYADGGGPIPVDASPSQGAIPDDVPAQINDSGASARLNAGEFVVPKDVVSWLGEKGMQNFILKARKEMGDPNQAPAQPQVGPPPGAPPIPPRGVGAIPDQQGAMS
jgi:hypothetical protein